MTNDEADKLLAENEWATHAEARELLQTAYALGKAAGQREGDKDAIRWINLRDWLVGQGLLSYTFCRPTAGSCAGAYWVFRGVYMVDGTKTIAWGNSADETLDLAFRLIGLGASE